ncbi:MAG: tetratricopeptide repeat protein [Pirellulaceae bacterium]
MVVTPSRRRAVGWACLASCCWLLAAGPLPAQQTAPDANALSRQLQQEAKAATTCEELNQVLTKISELQNRRPSPQVSQYLAELQAWVLHRRGEAYVKQAAEAGAANQASLSRQLDGKAMEDFDAAIHLDPTRWKSYHHRGVCYALAAQFDKALSDFSMTIELRPDYASAWFNRGEIHYEMGQFAKAIADYDQAIRLQDDDAGFFTGRGHAHAQLRQFDRALDDYHQAVRLDPDSPDRITNRGDAYRSLGQWERAADDYRHAIRLDSQFGRAFQSAAWLMATCPDAEFRHRDLAVRAAQKAIELDGNQDYIYLDTLAAAWANSDQFDKAQEAIGRALHVAPPESSAPLKHRSNLYRNGKPFRQSIDAATKRVASKTVSR